MKHTNSNTKMKLLALAILGLGGIAVAGSAAAACPSSPTPPWSNVSTLGGGIVAIADGGLDTSSCKLNTSFGSGAGGFAAAVVGDDSPSNEPHYRFQFLIDADGLTTISGFQIVQIFTANSAAQFPISNGHSQVVRMGIIPGGTTGKQVSVVVACDGVTDNVCIGTPVSLQAGVNRIEGEVVIGGAGTGVVRYWVNNTTESSPDGSISVDNAGWGGINMIFLGLSASTPSFRSSQAGHIVSFDSFDSRRQTFIGG